MSMTNKTCCFIGHRKINDTETLRHQIYSTVLKLIKNGVTVFLFGSRSEFNNVCFEIVSKIKRQFPHIKRTYIRAEYQYIDDNYKAYLMSIYDETYFSNKAKNAGRASYVKRNLDMIDHSDICVFYYNYNYVPLSKPIDNKISLNIRSGTKIAFEYAISHNKNIINLYSKTDSE